VAERWISAQALSEAKDPPVHVPIGSVEYGNPGEGIALRGRSHPKYGDRVIGNKQRRAFGHGKSPEAS
jgi:hypothetical protein